MMTKYILRKNQLRLVLLALCLVRPSSSLSSRVVTFPMKSQYHSVDVNDRLTKAFHGLINSAEFLQTAADPAVYRVPLFGEDFEISFGEANKVASFKQASYAIENAPAPHDFVLNVQGSNDDDFEWLCRKMYENRNDFSGIDMSNLRYQVMLYSNAKQQHPGYASNTAKLACCDTMEKVFDSSPDKSSQDVIQDLCSDGFAVIDTMISTTKESNQMLGDFLCKKTGQGDSIRTDFVGFLKRNDAIDCGLDLHYDVLMGVASYLNNKLTFDAGGGLPIAPATLQDPLTIPNGIQAAEYGPGGFYVAHSDNSWSKGKHLQSRSNLRSITAILYCNEDWCPSDGGALRIYKNSQNLEDVDDATRCCEFQDIFPKNGRLLLFDSKLVHSVREVTANKPRRALTVWIKQPKEAN